MATGAAATWVREVCDAFLDFEARDWDAMMADRATPGKNGLALEEWFAAGTPKGTPLFVYAVTHESVVDRVVRELVEADSASALPGADGEGDAASVTGESAAGGEAGEASADSAPAAGDAATVGEGAASSGTGSTTALTESKEKEAAEKEGAERAGSAAGDGGAAAAVEGDEAPPADGPDSPPRKRMVERERVESVRVKTCIVTACLRTAPPDLEVPVAYLLKTRGGAIAPPTPGTTIPAPAPAAAGGAGRASDDADGAAPASTWSFDDYMADCVEYGSMAPDLLSSMETLMRDVFLPFLEPQLGGKGGSGDVEELDAGEGQSIVSGMPQGMGAGELKMGSGG